MEIVTNSVENTRSFARKIAKKLKGGSILAFYGGLGAGKTTFIQGLAQGLGFSDRVFSPTFIIARPYKIGDNPQIKTLYHIDLYRIEKKADLETIGIQEFLFDKSGVAVIEWPEKIEKYLPKTTIKVTLEKISLNKRKITLDSKDPVL
jgi:tRNA threonylcarbamoyladenosine biosynthesis protein TsaE